MRPFAHKLLNIIILITEYMDNKYTVFLIYIIKLLRDDVWVKQNVHDVNGL